MSYFEYQDSPVSSNTTSAVARAYARFSKSPLVLLAILAYTGYTVIATIQSLPMLEYLGDCFEILGESFLLFLTMISMIFLFVGPVLITVGLWTMYASGGIKGANTVCGGIRTYVMLSVTMLVSIQLFFVVEFDALDYLGEILEEMYLSLGLFIFNMVASVSLCAFANASEYTAVNSKANVDGVAKAGILILITCGLNLLVYFDVFESMNYGEILDTLDAEDEKLANIAQICHIVAYGLFGVAALVYNGAMTQAGAEDRGQERQEFIKPMPPRGETWTCSCGRVNAVYCSSCVCGASKPVYVPQQISQTVQTTAQENPVTGRIICPKCGRENSAEAKFCGACGNKLGD